MSWQYICVLIVKWKASPALLGFSLEGTVDQKVDCVTLQSHLLKHTGSTGTNVRVLTKRKHDLLNFISAANLTIINTTRSFTLCLVFFWRQSI